MAWKPASNLDNLIDSIAGTSGCEENLDVVCLRGARWMADDGGTVETGRDVVIMSTFSTLLSHGRFQGGSNA